MTSLDGKRVLFFAPRFFGYENDIRMEIERQGAYVDWLPDRPFDSSFMKGVTKVSPKLVHSSASRYYLRLLAGMGATHYDYVFVVNGQTLSSDMLQGLRGRFPTAKFILYLWDSIENRASVLRNISHFDDVLSFDPVDCKLYGLRLRPLFFSTGFQGDDCIDWELHLSFIGTMHSDRYVVIDRLRRSLDSDLSIFWYLYIQAPWVLQIYRLKDPAIRRAQRDEFRFVPLEKSKCSSIFARSRAILDIEHPRQRGLTMRTFETLGMHKKLVTTNANVRGYDFFDSNNICVLDRLKPVIPRQFLQTPYKVVRPEIYRRYSLEGWIQEVFSLGNIPQQSSDGSSQPCS